MDVTNVKALADAGAEILVAGNAVYGGGNAERDTRRLVEAAR